MNDKAFGCVNNTIRLLSGRYLDLADPKPDQFTLLDIAGGLAKICRYGGQVPNFYSVAEHSVLCAVQAYHDDLSLPIQRACLMHDAAEAFIGDCVKPLKIMLPDYAVIERRLEEIISFKFDIDLHGFSNEVGKIDREMLIAEKRAFMQRDSIIWRGQESVRVIEPRFKLAAPAAAEAMFLEYAKSLQIADGE